MPPPPRAAAAAAVAASATALFATTRRPFAAAAAASTPPPPPPRKPRSLPWTSSTFARTALPMFGFVVVAWFGLEQLIDSKLRIRAGVRGHDKLEEYDPLERLRRMATTTKATTESDGGEGAKKKRSKSTAPQAPDVPSLEEELAAMNRKLGDTRKFEYVPVPRTDEEE